MGEEEKSVLEKRCNADKEGTKTEKFSCECAIQFIPYPLLRGRYVPSKNVSYRIKCVNGIDEESCHWGKRLGLGGD